MFILEGKNPVPCNNVVEWGKWFETADRNVAKSGDKERVHISTVFLGLDHSFSTGAVPLLFETMIFGGEHNQYQDRCSTWEEAENMHNKACALAGVKP